MLPKRVRKSIHRSLFDKYIIGGRTFSPVKTKHRSSLDHLLVEGPWRSENHIFVSSNSFIGRPLSRSEKVVPEKVVVSVYGNFGNQILETIVACYVATQFRVPKVILRESGVFRVGEHQIGEVTVVAPDRSLQRPLLSDAIRTFSVSRSPERHLAGTFLLNWMEGEYEFDLHRLELISSQVPATLNFELSGDPLGLHDLTVSFRGGDAFSQKPHPAYGQPPLAYYQFVVDSRKWNHVRVVSDDWQNPTLQPFLSWLALRGVSFEYVEQDWRSDVSLLFRSRNVVAPRGSFVPAVYAISPFIQTMYHFGPLESPVCNERVRIVVDKDQTFSRSVLGHEWTASEEQLDLMMSFSRQRLCFLS